MHCHRDEQELANRLAGFQEDLNQDPNSVHILLRPKTHLDPEEEKLRVCDGAGFSRLATTLSAP